MKLFFVGGGTLGPVTPLLAVAKILKKRKPGWSLVWIGTPNGPEKELVDGLSIPFKFLPVVKWPRYPSWRWLTFPFAWLRVHRLADGLIDQLKPDAIVMVGGFTAVPIVYAAAKKKIPCFTHQLDLVPGLANKKIAPHCVSVTTSFEYERAPFGDRITDEQIPTPTLMTHDRLPAKYDALHHFGLKDGMPVTLVFGGGTGALALNLMMERTIKSWLKFTQIIHGTGVGRGGEKLEVRSWNIDGEDVQRNLNSNFQIPTSHGYVVREFFGEEMAMAYSAADLIICRGGMGTLSEIAALKKAMIIIPIPKSHQEFNAKAFEERGADVVIHQNSKNFDQELLTAAKLLLGDEKARREMGEWAHQFLPTDDGSALAERIIKIIQGKA